MFPRKPFDQLEDLDAFRFFFKQQKRGRCRELLASKEFENCAPSHSVLVYPRENRRAACLGENLPHKGVSPARALPVSALC